jgi:hypothetical protein
MVGTSPNAFASGAFAHPTNHRGTAIQPYRRAANLRKIFRKTMAAAFSFEAPRRRIIAAEKTRLAA